MDWMIKIFFCILINGVIGSAAFGIWKCFSGWLEKRHKYMLIYHFLRFVIAFYIIPAPLFVLLCEPVRHLMAGYAGRFPLHHTRAEDVIFICIGVWITGMSCALIYYLRECRGVRRMIRSSRELDDPSQAACFERICMRRSFFRPVNLYENPLVSTPVIVRKGLRTIILLPDIAYNDQEFEIILEHETVHARHHDLLVKKILIWLRIVLWFFPSVPAMLRELGDWSETACDIEMCGVGEAVWSKKQYFEPMLNHLPVESAPLYSALALNTDHLQLMTRMHRMKEYGEPALKIGYHALWLPVSLLISLTVLYGLLAGGQQIGNGISVSVAELQGGELSAYGNTLISKRTKVAGEGERINTRCVHLKAGTTLTVTAIYHSSHPDCANVSVGLENMNGESYDSMYLLEDRCGKKEWQILEDGRYRISFYNQFGHSFRVSYQVTEY